MIGHAVVVGAGVAGLAAASFLARRGWSVTLVERRRDAAATTGTALVLRDSVVRALEAEGVDGARTAGVLLRTLALGDRSGRVRLRQRFAAGREAVSISRPALVELLAPLLDGVEHAFGTEVTAADLPALSAGADVVIAADGVFSRVRAATFGDAQTARFVGSTVWRGAAPGMARDLTEYWSRGARFGISAREGGLTNWYATLPSSAPAGGTLTAADHRRILQEAFSGWNPAIDAVLGGIDPTQVLHHDVYDAGSTLSSYVRGSVVLIGDAAHAMTPDLGRGASESLVDACCLADALSTAESVADALGTYDRRRRHATQRIAALSRTVGRVVNRLGSTRPAPAATASAPAS